MLERGEEGGGGGGGGGEGGNRETELTDFSEGAGSLRRAQQLMYIYLTREERRSLKINKFP